MEFMTPMIHNHMFSFDGGQQVKWTMVFGLVANGGGEEEEENLRAIKTLRYILHSFVI